MKKFAVLTALCLFCSLCTVIGETEEVRFQIQADSALHQEAELKNKVLEVYSELTAGVDAQSRPVMIAQNIQAFEIDENIQATYQDNTVIIVQGDGRGSFVHGSFDAFSCGRPVHPKSWIAELLGK